ncbi:MAG: 2-dehydropantoate 2-reductase, partial [Deltaproteobacteria bacterium]|nr:2-dehydropantoate 2-reductase [Deltaproteobacteria bacterium]
TYVGGKLLAHGTADVTLVGRPRGRDEVAAHGLCVCGLEGAGEHVAAQDVRYVTDVGELSSCDVVIVSVKSAQTREAAQALAGVVRGDVLIVSFQNGVNNAEVLREHFAGPRVAPAIVGFNVVGRGGGVYHRGMDGALVIEDRATPLLGALVRALEGAGLDVETMGDIAPQQWTKLLMNLNNAVSALSGAPTQALLGEPAYRRIVAALIEEGARVLRAAGIRPAPLRGIPVRLMPAVLRLPQPLARLVLARQMKVDPEARSSMWEDLVRRRPTEVDYLNGEIVRLAEKARVAAPLNRKVVGLIRDAEADGEGSPGLDARALWAALRG